MPIVERGKSGLWIILYAMSGYGKTTLAASLMRLKKTMTGRNAMYVDFDGSAEDIPQSVPFDLFDPTPNPAVTEASIAGCDRIERAALEAVLECQQRKSSVFVADTVTMLGRRFFLSLPRPVWGEKGKDMRPVYAEAQARIYQWALRMPELQRQGTDVVWICHETISEVQDADGKIKELRGGPEVVSSKLIKTIPAFGRLVLRLNVIPNGPATVTRVIQVDSDGLYVAKDRLNAFDPRGVTIGVSPFMADGKPKLAEVFEEECLAMGEKVWRTVFKALSRRQSSAEGSSKQTPLEAAIGAPSAPKEQA